MANHTSSVFYDYPKEYKEKCSHNNKLLDYVRKKYDIIC